MTIKTKKIITVILLILLIVLLVDFVSANPKIKGTSGKEYEGLNEAWQVLSGEFRIVINGFLAIGYLTAILVFTVQMVQLAVLPSHPIKRRQAIVGMVISAISTALLGGINTFTALFYMTIFG